jgi:GAF domain-containing protein
VTVLELLTSQAAISLENTMLYRDLIKENRQRGQVEEALRHAQAELARVGYVCLCCFALARPASTGNL